MFLTNSFSCFKSGRSANAPVNPNDKEIVPIPAPVNPPQLSADAKGKAFCVSNCVVDHAQKNSKCLVGKEFVLCKRCTTKPDISDQSKKKVCKLVCSGSILPNSPCDFYGYLNNKKKQGNPALLAKYGLSILRKMLR